MIAAAAAVVLLMACARQARETRPTGDSTAVRQSGRGGAGTLHPPPYTQSVVFLGTSLTAGLGLDPSQAYPAVIQRRLDSLHLPWRAVNAGVSGETSAGALARLDWVLAARPAVLVVETGANDGLRGMDLDSTRANIAAIVRRARSAVPDIRVLLAGMAVPTNLGQRYETEFRRIFTDVAASEKVALIPFLLQGVGAVDSLNQADGIHPTAVGQRIVADNVWKVLGPMLAAGAGAQGSGSMGTQVPGRTDAQTHGRAGGSR